MSICNSCIHSPLCNSQEPTVVCFYPKSTDVYTDVVKKESGTVKNSVTPECVADLQSNVRYCDDGERKMAPKMARGDEKTKMSLLPMDILRELVVPAYQEGVIKYEKESWRRGFYISEMIDAANRHMESFMYQHEDFDPESFQEFGIMKHHLAGAIFSLLSALHTLKYRPELDDRRCPEDGDAPVMSVHTGSDYVESHRKLFEERNVVEQKGVMNHNCRTREDKIHKICKELTKKGQTLTIGEIANKLGVSHHIVKSIKHGETWKHISSKYGIGPYDKPEWRV